MVMLETMLTMNRRVGWNMEEVARLVAAYRFPPSYSCLLLNTAVYCPIYLALTDFLVLILSP